MKPIQSVIAAGLVFGIIGIIGVAYSQATKPTNPSTTVTLHEVSPGVYLQRVAISTANVKDRVYILVDKNSVPVPALYCTVDNNKCQLGTNNKPNLGQ